MENFKPEFLLAATLAACSMPAVDNTRDDVVNPDHGSGVYAYTNVRDVNEALHMLYREFLNNCEAEGSGATLSHITKDRDEVLLNNGCETPIRWVCNDLYPAQERVGQPAERKRVGQMGERIRRPTPFSCQAPRKVQDRADR